MNPLRAADTIMTAAARVEKWRQEFAEAFVAPLMKQKVLADWAALSPDQKDMLKSQQPELYNQIQTFMKEQ